MAALSFTSKYKFKAPWQISFVNLELGEKLTLTSHNSLSLKNTSFLTREKEQNY